MKAHPDYQLIMAIGNHDEVSRSHDTRTYAFFEAGAGGNLISVMVPFCIFKINKLF